jgi:hypothetical protein
MTQDDAVRWPGRKMLDRDGAKIGRIEEVFADPETEEPAWALVNTGESGAPSTFVPLEGAISEHQAVVLVPFTRDRVEHAPAFDADHDLTPDEEAKISRHYGLGRGGEPDAASPGHAEATTDAGKAPRPETRSPGAARGEGESPQHGDRPVPSDQGLGSPGRGGGRGPMQHGGTQSSPGGGGTESPEAGRGSPRDSGEQPGPLGGLRERIEEVVDRYTARREHEPPPARTEGHLQGEHGGREGAGARPEPSAGQRGASGGGPLREGHPSGGEAEPGPDSRSQAGGRPQPAPAEPRTTEPQPQPQRAQPQSQPVDLPPHPAPGRSEPAAAAAARTEGSAEEEPGLREGDEIGRRRGADGRMRRYVITELIEEPEEEPDRP